MGIGSLGCSGRAGPVAAESTNGRDFYESCYAFATGVVVAGLAASRFAGNPNPPAGPIGPTMLTLDQSGGMLEHQQRLLALGLREWESTVVQWGPSPRTAVFVGGGVVNRVHAIAPAGFGVVQLYDSDSSTDKGAPIASVYLSSFTGGPQNVTLERGVRVRRGLWIDLPQNTETTVIFRRDEPPEKHCIGIGTRTRYFNTGDFYWESRRLLPEPSEDRPDSPKGATLSTFGSTGLGFGTDPGGRCGCRLWPRGVFA